MNIEKKSHYRNAVIIAYKGNMGDVLSYVFTLKFLYGKFNMTRKQSVVHISLNSLSHMHCSHINEAQ